MRNVVIGVQYASIAEGSIPGAVLAVVKDSKLVYLKAYGNKSVYPDTVAMTTNTVFDLASLTKVVSLSSSLGLTLKQAKKWISAL